MHMSAKNLAGKTNFMHIQGDRFDDAKASIETDANDAKDNANVK